MRIDVMIQNPAGEDGGWNSRGDSPLPATGEINSVQLTGHDVGHPTGPGHRSDRPADVHQENEQQKDKEGFVHPGRSPAMENPKRNQRDGKPEEALQIQRRHEQESPTAHALDENGSEN